jgi:sigma-B regulation protein RsbU (phosphoserine phosphatase)
LLKVSFETWVTERWSLQDFANRLNHQLCSLTPDESFAAAFLGIHDTFDGELSYVNCGHSPVPRLVSAEREAVTTPLLEGQTMLLGILEQREFTPATVALRCGDTLAFVTDGIPEAEGDGGERYGEERMDRLLAAGHATGPAELIRGLMTDLRGFVDGGAPDDDLTVLAMRVNGISGAPPRT